MKLEGMPVWVVDVEIFQNYFVAVFYNGEKWKIYEDISELAKDINHSKLCLAGFNSFKYDEIVLAHIAKHPTATCEDLYALSNVIVNGEGDQERIFKLTYDTRPWALSIDVFQLVNAKGSLKEWMCRNGAQRVAESPCDFTKPLDLNRVEEIKDYCKNDALETWNMLVARWELVELRTKLKEMYGLMSSVYHMSEQSVAQHTFMTLHRNRTGQYSADTRELAKQNPNNQRDMFPLTEIISSKIVFTTEEFNAFFTDFRQGQIVRNKTWELVIPNREKEVILGGCTFAIGVGGLHSVDKPGIFRSTEQSCIVDLDVTSYYPRIIINENLYPQQIGPGFVEDMRMLCDQRVDAKRKKQKVIADALKIVVNATFGKLDDAWSPIRSAIDAKRVCINGQLFLLMLVESLAGAGATILSANTDGLTISWNTNKVKRELPGIVKTWEAATGFELERTNYSVYVRRDVNNYIAMTDTGKIKAKGFFENPKGDARIVSEACAKYFTEQTPVEQIINECQDIAKFLRYTRTKNGAYVHANREMIGKSCRWYNSTGGVKLERLNPPTAKRKEMWVSFPGSESVTLANVMPTEWPDIDRDWYIAEANKHIQEIENPRKSCSTRLKRPILPASTIVTPLCEEESSLILTA